VTPFQRLAKFWAEVLLPARVLTAIRSMRARNSHRRWLRDTGYIAATLQFIDRYGTRVSAGPFVGMQYPREALLVREAIPVLLGTYELELHEIVEQWPGGGYESVLNVGSGDGYYAVGLARRLGVPVHAYDAEYRERRNCRRMAELNGVLPLVTLAHWCSPDTISQMAGGRRVLVVCDCEGFEVELFTGGAVAALRHSDVLVELHTVEGIGTKALLCERFSRTHEIQVIPHTGVCAQESKLEKLGLEVRRFGRESRGDLHQSWLWAVAKATRRGV